MTARRAMLALVLALAVQWPLSGAAARPAAPESVATTTATDGATRPAQAPVSAVQSVPEHRSGPRRLNRVVAVIGRDIITEHELLRKAEGHLDTAAPADGTEGAKGGPAEAAGSTVSAGAARQEILRRVLDQEIGERLLERELAANKDKLGVTDKDVDKATEEVMRANNIGKDQLQAALYGQGLTMAEYRTKLRGQIERARLMQFKVQAKVQVKDSEVHRRCLERQRLGSQNVAVCAGHVLLAVPDTADRKQRQELRQKAEQIRDRLRAGEPLAKLAEQYSDDPGAPDGNLGCFHRGEMVEAFEDAAFAAADGEVSDVVPTSFGLHVIKVFSHRREAGVGCDDAQVLEAIKGELLQQEMARQMEVWLGELRQAAFVEVRL